MRRVAWLFLLAACGRGQETRVAATPGAIASTDTASTGQAVLMRVRVGERFSPASGAAALAAFRADVPAVDSGGECRVRRTGGSGATIVSAYYPSFDSARAVVTLFFDSAGSLVRFNERRGMVRYAGGRTLTPGQLDSVSRAADRATRSTTISLDYAIDQGVASNTGGGRPVDAVIGTVREVESLASLGPPTKVLAATRRRCGV